VIFFSFFLTCHISLPFRLSHSVLRKLPHLTSLFLPFYDISFTVPLPDQSFLYLTIPAFPSSSSGSSQKHYGLIFHLLSILSAFVFYHPLLRSSFKKFNYQLLQNSDIYTSTHPLFNISFSPILDMFVSTSSFPYPTSSIPVKFPPCTDSLLVTNLSFSWFSWF
jgi:hypothetical protein